VCTGWGHCVELCASTFYDDTIDPDKPHNSYNAGTTFVSGDQMEDADTLGAESQ